MAYVFGLLIGALLVKDTVPLGDNMILRGISEGLALVAGSVWLLRQGQGAIDRKYVLLPAYLVILFLTMFVTREPLHVALQVISLTAVIVFFVAYVESQSTSQEVTSQGLLTTGFRLATYMLAMVCLVSLLLLKFNHDWAYDHTIEGIYWDGIPRFKGLFGKPGSMAAAAGILLGLCLFGKVHLFWRIMGVFVSLGCLYLTFSRSFWAAAVLASSITAIVYTTRKRVLFLTALLVLMLAPILMTAVDVKVSSETQARLLRTDSLANLSGRTTLWTASLERFWDRPLLGYGFTLGHQAFDNQQSRKSSGDSFDATEAFSNKSFALHNGYIQALLDSGALGATLYIGIMGLGLWRVLFNDTGRKHGAVMYSLIFLGIGNGGETVITTAATFFSVFYWYVVIIALSLGRQATRVTVDDPVPLQPLPQPVTARYPLVSYRERRLSHLSQEVIRNVINQFTYVGAWIKRNQVVAVHEVPVKVNLGSGLSVAPGWINLDGSLNAFVSRWPKVLLKRLYAYSDCRQWYSSDQYLRSLKSHRFVCHRLERGSLEMCAHSIGDDSCDE
ncbi:MAG: hypothetical protein A2V62_06290 [Nitrospirae bacterium RBG_19FT_COMBO_58_9]|nr:MAG: hypothetical protein A2V62_06290 [Nitrospirae bacterium RBG_19FT_COMBO_58_9]